MLGWYCVTYNSAFLSVYRYVYVNKIVRIEIDTSYTLLGIIDITDTLSTAAYVDRLLMQVNKRLYLLSLLQSSGLQRSSLHLLFNALVINKLT